MLDKRLHACRDDLADARLRNAVVAEAYVEGEDLRCIAPLAALHKSPAPNAMQLTQVLMGETVRVFERKVGWAWVQLLKDGYVGYVREDRLASSMGDITHHVTTPLAHLFAKADLKSTPAINVPMNAGFSVVNGSGDYLQVGPGQFVYAQHCAPLATSDYVSVAELFVRAPYLWGGKSAMGVDCSGLVQVSMQACGLDCPRDSDMQETALGIDMTDQKLRRGDLVFWKGHVGMMQDAKTLLHANAHHLMVVSEPLAQAVARISAKGSEITSIKRLQ
jgi:Bacterial dipeptidyl-peptidase Sh3 domain/NlpC/P60 family